MQISPLAPAASPTLPPLAGVRLASVEAGIKYRGRPDLMVMVFDAPAQIAGVFTRSKCASAPVDWCKSHIANGIARAIVVNSGNANAFTGMRGAEASRQTAEATAQTLDCKPGEVFLASTGVIGEPLEASKFTPLLERLIQNAKPGGWPDAAAAIMTTDTFAKLATVRAKIGDSEVILNGIAKGSGMIAPDMATMLSFIVTDAPLSARVLQDLLKQAVGTSYNSITVDSDTSTSDTVLLAATGGASSDDPNGDEWLDDPSDPVLDDFKRALFEITRQLALLIVRDGEGVSKLASILVTGASSDESAKIIAFSIANSPLVKTALAGEDANWGRVVMAVGKAGEPADRDRLSIWFSGIRVALNGNRDPDYDEDIVAEKMKQDEIHIRADLGLGSGKAEVWTCDLTKTYVAINGDYRS